MPSHGIAPEAGNAAVRRRTAFPPETEGRATAFPSGDLPEPPGGPKEAALILGAMARGAHFPPPAPFPIALARWGRGPALHREAKCFPAAILRFAAALAGAPRLRLRLGDRREGRDGRGRIPSGRKAPP